MSNTCEVCGKPQSPYPNWIITKGRQMHVGCMADALEKAEAKVKELSEWKKNHRCSSFLDEALNRGVGSYRP